MTRKKRILYLSNSYPLTMSGVTTVVRNLLTWMQDEYEIGIICPNTTTRYSKKIINGITHYYLPSYPTVIRKDVRFITPNPRQVEKAFDDFHPDIVHMHDPSPASAVLRDLALSHDIPVIFSHHFTPQMVLGYLPSNIKVQAQNNAGLNKAILQLTCRMYEGASRIVVPTRTVADSLQLFTHIPVSVISSGIDYHKFQEVDSTQIATFASLYHLPSSPFILYVGRIDPEKNLHILITAFARVVQHFPDIRLVITGDGSSVDKLKVLAKELKIARKIIWTGPIPHDELVSLYRNPQAKVFVIPSPIESQSIVTLMALASGLPIVGADAAALPEIVIDRQTGFLCNPEKDSDFANAIVTCLQNPAEARHMGQFGSKIAAKHDTAIVQKAYKDLYEKAVFYDRDSHPQ